MRWPRRAKEVVKIHTLLQLYTDILYIHTRALLTIKYDRLVIFIDTRQAPAAPRRPVDAAATDTLPAVRDELYLA